MFTHDLFLLKQVQKTVSENITQRKRVRNQSYQIFQNDKAWEISSGNSYSEDQLMHTFLDNFHQGGK